MKKEFFRAIDHGDLKTLKECLEKEKFLLASTNVSGQTALHRAAEGGYLEIVKYLYKTDMFDIDKKDNKGNTALKSAAVKEHFEVVQFLVENGANMNEPNQYGDDPVSDAASLGHDEILNYLLEKGAFKDIQHRRIGNKTPLMLAIMMKKPNTVETLLRYKADIHLLDQKYTNAYEYGIDSENEKIRDLMANYHTLREEGPLYKFKEKQKRQEAQKEFTQKAQKETRVEEALVLKRRSHTKDPKGPKHE